MAPEAEPWVVGRCGAPPIAAAASPACGSSSAMQEARDDQPERRLIDWGVASASPPLCPGKPAMASLPMIL